MDVLARARLLATCLLLSGSAMLPAARAGDDLRLHEQEIKAGLLYNFLKYTRWPASSFARSSFVTVCIFGNDPFDGNLNLMKGRTVNQREISIRQISDLQDMDDCHLIFVNEGEKKLWPKLHDALAGKNILTVSDFATFVASGGMIEFGRKGNHIGVTLNMDAVSMAQLQVEDRLLKLVTVIRSEGNP